jgi:CRP/FNR family transcriptional regulator, cyclic AMP receptor protein
LQTLDELIAEAPVFAGLDAEYLKLIANCSVNARFAAGELLVREGDPAELFYLLRAGSVAIELDAPAGGPLLIETLYAGDVVGWAWLFEPYRWAFDARAREPVRAVAFDGACLRGKCEADHELGYELMRRFAASLTEDLQATRLQLLDVYGHARVD